MTSLIHALALVFGTALYVYLFAVLSSQRRAGAPGRMLLALVASSGLWYLGWLSVFYLRLTIGSGDSALITAVSVLAHAGGWASWPAGIAVAWFAYRDGELHFYWAILAAGAISGIASGVWTLGSLQIVLATLPVPLVIIFFLYREQVFGLLLPRSALLAAALGGGAALYVLAVPLAAALLESSFGSMPEGVRSLLLLGGVILWLTGEQGRGGDRLGKGLSVIVAALGTVVLAEYATGTDLGIDRLFISEGSNVPERMSAISALSFLLFGSAHLAAGRKGGALYFINAHIFGLLLNYLAIIGYIYDVTLLYGPYAALTMSYPAAISTFLPGPARPAMSAATNFAAAAPVGCCSV